MARSVNKVILLGHIGKDAETRFTTGGSSVSNFTLATNRRWKDKQTGEWKDETDWHKIIIWSAEKVSPYLLKGKQVYVEGRIQNRSYDDKDGQKRYVTEIVAQAEDVILLGGQGGRGGEGDDEFEPRGSGMQSAPRSAQRQSPAAQNADPGFPQGVTDDDVPF